MATQTSFSSMLAQFAPDGLFKEEMVKRDYILSKVEKDDSWLAGAGDNVNSTQTTTGIAGGPLTIRFKGAQASSQRMGGLTGQANIVQARYVLGQILVQPETWGSLIFNHKDIMVHGKISKLNFLDVLSDNLEDFMEVMKYNISTALLEGPAYCKIIAAVNVGTNTTGTVLVDRPDRLHIGQMVVINVPAAYADNTHAPVPAFVKSIDLNSSSGGQPAGSVVLCTDIGLTTPLDFTAANVQGIDQNGDIVAPGGATTSDISGGGNLPANTTLLYMDGVLNAASVPTNQFSNLRSLLLPASAGGSAAIYGVTKTAYPYTQAIYLDGSGVTAVNIVKKCFYLYTHTRRYGKGRPTDFLMSYNNLGLVMAVVEASKGAFNVVPNSFKANQYGWKEITIGSVTGETLKFVGIQEMGDDWIALMDWRAVKFYSNGMFRKRKSPDGIEYFEIRNNSGFQYIVDVALFGDIVLLRPSYCGAMAAISINYTTAFA